jgi:hypothetical protein
MKACPVWIRLCDFCIQEFVNECKNDLGRKPTSLRELEQRKGHYEELKAKFLSFQKWMEGQELGTFWYCLVPFHYARELTWVANIPKAARERYTRHYNEKKEKERREEEAIEAKKRDEEAINAWGFGDW